MANGVVKRRSPVAKHLRSFNLASYQTDRKKAANRGHRKHRGKSWE